MTNPNATVALSGIGFADTLSAGLTIANPNGLSGSCGAGTITAVKKVTLSGGTLGAGTSCTFSVNVTAKSGGVKHNVTSPVTSTEGGAGNMASANLNVVQAATTTTVTATPSNPSLGSPVTFTATVAPSGPNASGVDPTGTVSFFLDGQATPVATVPLGADGTASFTTSGLGAGDHTITAAYSGDGNFRVFCRFRGSPNGVGGAAGLLFSGLNAEILGVNERSGVQFNGEVWLGVETPGESRGGERGHVGAAPPIRSTPKCRYRCSWRRRSPAASP